MKIGAVDVNVTARPTAAWIADQVVEAFPYDTAPRFLLRDRDAYYGEVFRRCVRGMGIQEVLIAPQAPWQNPYAERLVGSIRRDCLDHVLVLGEAHLRRILAAYLRYYHEARPHLALARNAPCRGPSNFRAGEGPSPSASRRRASWPGACSWRQGRPPYTPRPGSGN